MTTSYSLSGTVKASIQYTYERTDEIGDTTEGVLVENKTTYTSGDDDNEVDQMYRVQVTVTAGSPNSDVTVFGSVEDVFGQTVNIERVKAILVRNLSETSGDNIYVGPLGCSNALVGPWVDSDGNNKIGPGGALLLDAPIGGYAVEDDADTFRVQYQGSSGSINVQVAVVGSAAPTLESSSSSSSVGVSSSSSSSLSSSSQSSVSVSYSSSSQSLESSSSSSTSSISSQG